MVKTETCQPNISTPVGHIHADGKVMADTYSNYYYRYTHHGPQESRDKLDRRAKESFIAMQPGEWALDLGAGRQLQARQLVKKWGKQSWGKIVTVDIANLASHQLLAEGSKRITHMRANGATLPFPDNTFSIAFSHMGLELMPEETIAELARVLKPEGRAFINVLDPSIVVEKKGEEPKKRRRRRTREDNDKKYWEYYGREGNIFLRSLPEIQTILEGYGFKVETMREVESRYTPSSWVEIDLIKKPASQDIMPAVIDEIDTSKLRTIFSYKGK